MDKVCKENRRNNNEDSPEYLRKNARKHENELKLRASFRMANESRICRYTGRIHRKEM